jgi:hypothetical protein
MTDQKDDQKKEAFVGQQDRPSLQLDPDQPITSLRVRDLAALMATPAKVVEKHPEKLTDKFFEKPFIVDTKLFIHDKFALKDVHDSKQIKDIIDNLHTIPQPIQIPDPGPELRQTIDQLVKEVAQLRQEVSQLKR